jgi:hypothetical protein
MYKVNLGMNRKVILERDGPRRLSATIAAKSIAVKRSRVSIEDMDTTIDYIWTGHEFLFTSVMQILINVKVTDKLCTYIFS